MLDEVTQLLVEKCTEIDAENVRLRESVRVLKAENAKFREVLVRQHGLIERAGLLSKEEQADSSAEQAFESYGLAE